MSTSPMSTCSDWKQACFDVVARRAQDEQNEKSSGQNISGRDGAFSLGDMWPNGQRLTYCFLDPHPGTPLQQKKVKCLVKEWEEHANVTFDHVDTPPDALIRITFNPNDGSWSYIGRNNSLIESAYATMNLACVDNTEDVTEIDKGVVLHEFGHVLGLGHEHESPSRGGLLTLREEPIVEYYTSCQQWTRRQISDDILRVYNGDQVITNYSIPDMGSIMKFFVPATMNEQNMKIRPNHQFSDLDKAFMTLSYPPDNNTNKIEKALDAVGAGERKNRIIEGYQKSGWAGLREEFAEWSKLVVQHGAPNMSIRVTEKEMSPENRVIHEAFRRMGVLNDADSKFKFACIPPPKTSITEETWNPISTMSTSYDWKQACFDVVARSVQDEQNEQPSDYGSNQNSRSKNVAFPLGDMWPNGQRLTYCFMDPYPGTPHQQRKVRLLIKEWETHANVRFDHVDSLDAVIRITFDSNDCSWSYIGRDNTMAEPPRATMNLAWVENTEDITEIDRGVILHEFGHTLGLRHEHQCPSHGGLLTLNNAILDYYIESQGMRRRIPNDIRRVYNKEQVTNYSKPDVKSIMMYFMPTSMNKQKIDIKPNNELSDMDKAFMMISYPPDNDNITKIDQALDTFGVVERKKNEIIESYQKSGWVGLREKFAQWLVIQRDASIMNPSKARVVKKNVAVPTVLSPEAQAIEGRRLPKRGDP